LVPDAYRGMDRFEARKTVIKDITAEGLAVMVPNPKAGSIPPYDNTCRAGFTPPPVDENGEPTYIPYIESKKIMQPFCDRSRVVMEPMLTDQWYVDAEKLAGPARDAVTDGRVKIMPESGEKVYFHLMENIEPWCISRQLWWGHQIPVWYGPREIGGAGRFVSLADEAMRFCAATYEEAKNEILKYYQKQTEKTVILELYERDELAGNITTANIEGDRREAALPLWNITGEDVVIRIYRDPDVLDTWFSSGLWPIGTLGWPDENDPAFRKYFPTSTLITGQDILFFWVARMMMMQLEITGKVPFSTVYLHQLVRDENGVKMSKTLGNVIDPLDMIDEFGADAVRFTMTSMAAIGGSLKLSTDRIKGYRNFTTKLWNAARFTELNGVFGSDESPTQFRLNSDISQTLNKWIIGEVVKTREAVDTALTAYRFNDAANTLYSFVWGTFCDWYIEFSKPLLYGDNPAVLAETRAVMGWALDQCLILLHPIMPFITEELWGITGSRTKMLIHADWPTYQAADYVDENADREMNWVITLIEAIRSARMSMHVPVGLKIPMLTIELDDAGRTAWHHNEALIKRLARIDGLSPADAVPKGAITIPVRGGVFALPLADVIDLDEEKLRLQKTISKLSGGLNGLRARLDNPNFVASAPADVVADSRKQLSEKENELEKLNAALRRLDELA
ncbi:MAG: class I tRNA ligase family protein, partial [Paracoccaceae bacterium]